MTDEPVAGPEPDGDGMCVRWWTVGTGPLGMIAGLWHVRMPGCYLALYGPSPEAKARALVVVELDWVPSWRGRACGVLVGGLLTIEVDGRSVTLEIRNRDADVRTAPRW